MSSYLRFYLNERHNISRWVKKLNLIISYHRLRISNWPMASKNRMLRFFRHTILWLFYRMFPIFSVVIRHLRNSVTKWNTEILKIPPTRSLRWRQLRQRTTHKQEFISVLFFIVVLKRKKKISMTISWKWLPKPPRILDWQNQSSSGKNCDISVIIFIAIKGSHLVLPSFVP